MDLDATKKHIILRRLEDLRENAPNPLFDVSILGYSPLRQWLARVGAVIKVYDPIRLSTAFDTAISFQSKDSQELHQVALGYLLRAIEEIKTELELEGRSEVGNAYGPGEVYRYFADLKRIVGGATKELLIVDPYFNGEAFDSYLAEVSNKVSIRLFLEHKIKELSNWAGKHCKQFGTQIELRSSKQLHDRVLFVDCDDCWISGGSIKDGGKKPTYLIPLAPRVAEKKLRIYEELWSSSKVIDLP